MLSPRALVRGILARTKFAAENMGVARPAHGRWAVSEWVSEFNSRHWAGNTQNLFVADSANMFDISSLNSLNLWCWKHADWVQFIIYKKNVELTGPKIKSCDLIFFTCTWTHSRDSRNNLWRPCGPKLGLAPKSEPALVQTRPRPVIRLLVFNNTQLHMHGRINIYLWLWKKKNPKWRTLFFPAPHNTSDFSLYLSCEVQ